MSRRFDSGQGVGSPTFSTGSYGSLLYGDINLNSDDEYGMIKIKKEPRYDNFNDKDSEEEYNCVKNPNEQKADLDDTQTGPQVLIKMGDGSRAFYVKELKQLPYFEALLSGRWQDTFRRVNPNRSKHNNNNRQNNNNSDNNMNDIICNQSLDIDDLDFDQENNNSNSNSNTNEKNINNNNNEEKDMENMIVIDIFSKSNNNNGDGASSDAKNNENVNDGDENKSLHDDDEQESVQLKFTCDHLRVLLDYRKTHEITIDPRKLKPFDHDDMDILLWCTEYFYCGKPDWFGTIDKDSITNYFQKRIPAVKRQDINNWLKKESMRLILRESLMNLNEILKQQLEYFKNEIINQNNRSISFKSVKNKNKNKNKNQNNNNNSYSYSPLAQGYSANINRYVSSNNSNNNNNNSNKVQINMLNIQFDSNTAASLFVQKFKIKYKKEIKRKCLTIGISNFDKKEWDHLLTLFKIDDYWHYFNKMVYQFINIFENASDYCVWICSSLEVQKALKDFGFKILHVLERAGVAKRCNVPNFPSNLRPLSMLKCIFNVILLCGTCFTDVKRALNPFLPGMELDTSEKLHEFVLLLIKQSPKYVSNCLDMNSKQNLFGNNNHDVYVTQWCKFIQFVIPKCEPSFIVDNAALWFTIVHQPSQGKSLSIDPIVRTKIQPARWVFGKIVPMMGMQHRFNFALYLVEFSMHPDNDNRRIGNYMLNPSRILTTKYYDFIKEVGIDWDILPSALY